MKIVFIQTQDDDSAWRADKMLEAIGERLRGLGVGLVLLPPGCSAVAADGPKFGIEEAVADVSYKVWGETKAEVEAMRVAILDRGKRNDCDEPILR